MCCSPNSSTSSVPGLVSGRVELPAHPTPAPTSKRLIADTGAHIVQVQCAADGQVVLDRFTARSASVERHPGHCDGTNLEEFHADLRLPLQRLVRARLPTVRPSEHPSLTCAKTQRSSSPSQRATSWASLHRKPASVQLTIRLLLQSTTRKRSVHYCGAGGCTLGSHSANLPDRSTTAKARLAGSKTDTSDQPGHSLKRATTC